MMPYWVYQFGSYYPGVRDAAVAMRHYFEYPYGSPVQALEKARELIHARESVTG